MLNKHRHDTAAGIPETIRVATTRKQIKKQSTLNVLSMHYPQADLLWVDKYGPKKFTDLISADSTNTTVLKWCSRWKKYLATKEHQDDLNNVPQIDNASRSYCWGESLVVVKPRSHTPPFQHVASGFKR